MPINSRLNDLLIKKEHSILVVDDNTDILDTINESVKNLMPDLNIQTCSHINCTFYDYIYQNNFDLCIMDVILGNDDAREISDEILDIKDDLIFLFISGYNFNLESFSHLRGRCIYDFMSKPFSVETLLTSIITLLNISTTYKLLKREKDNIDNVRKFYWKKIKEDKLMIKAFRNECKKMVLPD